MQFFNRFFLIATLFFSVVTNGMSLSPQAKNELERLKQDYAFLDDFLTRAQLEYFYTSPQGYPLGSLDLPGLNMAKDEELSRKIQQGNITNNDLKKIEQRFNNGYKALEKWISAEYKIKTNDFRKPFETYNPSQDIKNFGEEHVWFGDLKPSLAYEKGNEVKISGNKKSVLVTELRDELRYVFDAAYKNLKNSLQQTQIQQPSKTLSQVDLKELQDSYQSHKKFLEGKGIQSKVLLKLNMNLGDLTNLNDAVLQDIQAVERILGNATYDYEFAPGVKQKLNKQQIINQFKQYQDLIQSKIEKLL